MKWMTWYTAALVLAFLIQSVQANLHTVTQSLSVLFYTQDDVEQCSTGVCVPEPVCPELLCTQ